MLARIEYCTQWNYQPTAAGLAAELKEAFAVDAELVGGGGGIFDVHIDGELLFSKHAEGDRFPEPGEVVERIRTRSGA